MKRGILRIVIPALAGLSILGSGYAVFAFTGNGAELAQTGSVELAAETAVGVLSCVPCSRDGDVYTDLDSGYHLVVSQRRINFNFSAFHLSLVPEAGISPTSLTFSATMDLSAAPDVARYFSVSGWNPVAGKTGLYTFDLGTQAVQTIFNTAVDLYISAPTMFYTNTSSPVESVDVQEMERVLGDDVIRFTFNADLTDSGGASA